jgi:hypothetical protein
MPTVSLPSLVAIRMTRTALRTDSAGRLCPCGRLGIRAGQELATGRLIDPPVVGWSTADGQLLPLFEFLLGIARRTDIINKRAFHGAKLDRRAPASENEKLDDHCHGPPVLCHASGSTGASATAGVKGPAISNGPSTRLPDTPAQIRRCGFAAYPFGLWVNEFANRRQVPAPIGTISC